MQPDRLPGEKVLEYMSECYPKRGRCVSIKTESEIGFKHVKDFCVCDIEQSFLAGYSKGRVTAATLIERIDAQLAQFEGVVSASNIRNMIRLWKGGT